MTIAQELRIIRKVKRPLADFGLRGVQERLIQLFRRAAGETSTMSLEEFKKASEIKTHAFASRMFKAIDADGNGALTCEEFVNFFYTLQCNDFRGRIKVLFDLYDIDQSGSLSSYELECILMVRASGRHLCLSVKCTVRACPLA